MSGDSSLALQAAIRTKLLADSTLTAMLKTTTSVFDSVQSTADYPYISIGEMTGADLGSCTYKGMQQTVKIHTWTQARGRMTAKQIMGRVYDLLHEGTLTITGQSMVLCRFEFGETLLDPDGVTHHGVQRFRIITREA